MSRMTMNSIRYNAHSGTFEARVDVQQGGTTHRYPCAVSGPLTMSPDRVRSRLLAQAERMSLTGSSLRSVL